MCPVQVMVQLCGDRRDPAQPPLSPLPLLHAVNRMTGNRFDPRQPECAVFFLESVLENLDLLPQYLTSYEEAGDCVLCGQAYRQVCTELN